VSVVTAATYELTRPPRRERLAYQLRVLRVIARTQFKLKYVDSFLGYVWSLAKPLAYFGVLWVVFGRVFNTGVARFPLYLLLGIVLYTFMFDGVGAALPSILERGPLLRRIAFPPLVIPVSATVTAAMTFSVSLVAVSVFVAASRITPHASWLLLLPLLLQYYLFVLGLALIVSTLFVRFRDIGPIWELSAQLMLFASPLMYPITILPSWAQHVEMLNPFVQVLQDVRRIVIGQHASLGTLPTSVGAHAATLAITAVVLFLGVRMHLRDAPYFAEKV
jgi:ABC-2 type transport system permease protein